VRCVRDGELAGIFEMTTAAHLRRRGLGRAVIASALKWAAGRGARTAWLQVTAQNEAAIGLYSVLGFGEMYRYRYWRAHQ
jgi:ribosomal protein S18 acetylase RimI-like enzyme